MNKIVKNIISFLLLLLLGAGCSLTANRQADGGVWFSSDKGESWRQISFVAQAGKKEVTIANLEVFKLVSHSRDSRLIYAVTNQGIYFTENGGEQWTKIFNGSSIADLALDPNTRGIVYITLGGKILKTTDNGGSWPEHYVEPRSETLLTKLAVDPVEPAIVYAGTNRGDLLASRDYGKSWQAIFNFENDSLEKILINPTAHNQVYVATGRRGIFASLDGAASWVNLKDNYKDFVGADRYQQLIFYPASSNGLLYGSNFGLLRSLDGGVTWAEVLLVTPAGQVVMRNLTVNPQNPQEIYYTTETVLLRSFDAGVSWVAAALPSTRAAGAVLIDWFAPSRVYLGIKQLK